MPLFDYRLARPFLFSLAPESAHDLTVAALARTPVAALRWAWRCNQVDDPIHLAGLRFPNRVGLAAGLDKNARCVGALAALGFGFIELGTVTPQPQPGNPKPRMFRLPQAQALINRLGFNNDGIAAFVAHVQASAGVRGPCLLGLNIGKNASTPIEQAAQDYQIALQAVYAHADYVTVNISSPNTRDLRALQSDAALDGLLAAITAAREQLTQRHAKKVPLFVKIAPDLEAAQIASIAQRLRHHGIDGVIATNTTVARDAVQHLPDSAQAGGLSGAPLLQMSNQVIRQLRAALGPGFPIIGVGGILSGEDAVSKIEAGADVVQLYTGLIYRGPALIGEAARAIAAYPSRQTSQQTS